MGPDFPYEMTVVTQATQANGRFDLFTICDEPRGVMNARVTDKSAKGRPPGIRMRRRSAALSVAHRSPISLTLGRRPRVATISMTSANTASTDGDVSPVI